MKRSMGLVSVLTLLAGLMWLGRSPVATAAEDAGAAADRLERLERRVNEMVERQEQLLLRMDGQRERPAALGQFGREPRSPQLAPAEPLRPGQPAGPGAKLAKSLQDMLGLLFLIGVLCNILLAIWIFTDIRKRGEGSGIFVALALIAGIPAAVIYALTRLGDRKA